MFNDQSFKNILPNGIVSFEQQGPGLLLGNLMSIN